MNTTTVICMVKTGTYFVKIVMGRSYTYLADINEVRMYGSFEAAHEDAMKFGQQSGIGWAHNREIEYVP